MSSRYCFHAVYLLGHTFGWISVKFPTKERNCFVRHFYETNTNSVIKYYYGWFTYGEEGSSGGGQQGRKEEEKAGRKM